MSRSSRRLRALFIYGVAAALLWAALAERAPKLDPRANVVRAPALERAGHGAN